ncbi:MAG: Slp family lipoprotein [bacterium]|nr:Slp family lipoprotein [bacterium]
MRRLSFVVLLAAVLAACARPPRQLAGEFPPLTVAETQATGATGERIRWGGQIVRTTPGEGETCLEIVQKPLDGEARPRPVDETTGRFVACGGGFYDPAVFAAGREVTVVGTVEGIQTGKVGDSPYQFPRVRADTVYLWAPRRAYYYPYDPWGGPYWGYYGGWYGPYWGATWAPYPYYWGPGWWGSPFGWGGWWGGPRYWGGRGWNGRGWGGGGWKGGGGGRGGGGGGGRGGGGGGGGRGGGGGGGGGGRGR